MAIVVGIPGDQGIPGSTMWSTVGAPPNTLGNNGDWANDDTNFVFYGPKANGVWPAGNSYKGTNGATWRTGSGAPSNSLGSDGDLYLDTATANVWLRSSGTYSIIANIKGSNGTNGAAGAIGPRGISDRLLAAGSFFQATNSNPVLSNGTDTGVNGIETRVLPMGGGDVKMVWSNRNGTGAITLTSSAQWPSALTPEPITWNGVASVTIAAGATVESDPFAGAANVWGTPPPGTSVAFRHYITATAGVKWELTTTSGGGQVSGTGQSDQTGNYTFNYGGGGSAQIGMQGLVGTPLMTSKSVVAIGDSIVRGEGDSAFANGFGDGGPVYYAMGGLPNSNYAWANCAIVGETGQQFATSPQLRRQNYLKYADTIFVGYGTNDLGYNTSQSLATLQTTLLKTWWACQGYGAKVVALTLLPRSTSTDNFATVQNQTPVAGWGPGSTAAQYNTWLIAGAPILNGVPVAVGTSGALVASNNGHPLTAVCDWGAACEAGTRGSGVWISTGTANQNTVDGTHPNTYLATPMGALMVPYI